jgi:hypothetical protein
MDTMSVNNDIDNDFTLAEEEPQLGWKHPPLSPDRTTIAAEQARDTAFRANLGRVQYGTYNGKRACLVTFTFLFYFRGNTRLRFKSARISVRFSRALDARVPEDEDDNDDDDDAQDGDKDGPHIVQLAPVDVYGAVKTTDEEGTRGLTASLGATLPAAGGPTISVQPSYQYVTKESRDVRMRIQGFKFSSADSDIDDIAVWRLDENTVQRDGILPRFQSAVVLLWPETAVAVAANVKVVPEFAFLLNPCKLKQRSDDPILFDGKTPKGDPVDPGMDFGDQSYNWMAVVGVPTEYQVSSLPSQVTGNHLADLHYRIVYSLTKSHHRLPIFDPFDLLASRGRG